MRCSLSLFVVCLATPSIAVSAQPCDDQASRVATTLGAIPSYVQLVAPQIALKLPKGRAKGEIKRLGLAIDISDGRFAFRRARAAVDAIDALKKELDSVTEVEMVMRSQRAPAFLRIDKDQRVEPLMPMLCVLSKRRETVLVVDDPKRDGALPYRPAPPPPQLVDVLRQVDAMPEAAVKAAALSNLLSQAIGKCSALSERFEALIAAPAAMRASKIRSLVPEGLRACACRDVDVPALEALLVKILAPTQPPVHGRPLPIRCGGSRGEAVVRLPKDADAQSLTKALASVRGPFRIQFGD